MEREIRYVTTADGVRIAYAIQGEGVPFIWVPGWISHLDFDAPFLQTARDRPRHLRSHVGANG